MQSTNYIFNYFWVIALIVTLLNAVIFKFRSRKYIEKNPKLKNSYGRLIKGFTFWNCLPWIVMSFGPLTGHVTNLFEYFRPMDGNPYVLAFIATIVLEWILLVHWIFFRGGAETICQHPGLMNWTPPNPIMVKIFVVLCVAGGIAALTLMCTEIISVPIF